MLIEASGGSSLKLYATKRKEEKNLCTNEHLQEVYAETNKVTEIIENMITVSFFQDFIPKLSSLPKI